MAITTFTRQRTVTRPEVRGVVKDVSGRTVKNAEYADVSSSLEDVLITSPNFSNSSAIPLPIPLLLARTIDFTLHSLVKWFCFIFFYTES